MLSRIAVFAALIVAVAVSGEPVAFDVPAAQLERHRGRGIRGNRNRQGGRLPPELLEIRFRDLELDSEGPPFQAAEDLVGEALRRRYDAEVRSGSVRGAPMGDRKST